MDSSKKRHLCTYENCKASFVRPSKLAVHIRKHTGERPFACDVDSCDKTYTNDSHLRRHKKVCHEGQSNTETILCGYEGCGISVANVYSLKKHIARKHNVDNYEFPCNICGTGFHKKRQLQQHLYIHTGKPSFICDECGIGFATIADSNKHKRSHKTYTCECGELFHRWSHLVSHKREQHRKKHECDICERSFSQYSNLKSHKLSHLSEADRQLYECGYPDCFRVFVFKKNLIWHIGYRHRKINNPGIKCTYPKCAVILKTKASLRKHLLTHFKFIRKKNRKPRPDKGSMKRSIIAALTNNPDFNHAEHLNQRPALVN